MEGFLIALFIGLFIYSLFNLFYDIKTSKERKMLEEKIDELIKFYKANLIKSNTLFDIIIVALKEDKNE